MLSGDSTIINTLLNYSIFHIHFNHILNIIYEDYESTYAVLLALLKETMIFYI